MTLEDRADSAAPRRPLERMFEAFVEEVIDAVELDNNKGHLAALAQELLAEIGIRFSRSGFVAGYMSLGPTNAAAFREAVAALTAVTYAVPFLPSYRTQSSHEHRN